MPGRDVKHQGASEPSGFRQKFSRRSLGGRSPQLWWGPANLWLEAPHPAFLQAPPQDPAPYVPDAGACPQRRPATSLARVFLRSKTMPMRVLRVPPLAGYARGCGVSRAPVALALPVEATERRGLLARLCLRP